MIAYPVNSQIAVYKTHRKLVEFNDKLRPALLENYAHIHASGEKLPDGSRLRSWVGLVLQDYSSGTGQNMIRVTADLAPGFFPYVLSRIAAGTENFAFQEEKIFGIPDETGRSRVTKVTFRRTSVGGGGDPRRCPWYICLENGRAFREPAPTGGFRMRAGSYVLEKKVFLDLSDYDFFQLMYHVMRFIEVWEMSTGSRLIHDATRLVEATRMQDFY